MLDFIKALRDDGRYLVRLPAFAVAFAIAEFFYKFKSFALECAAFLVTWLVIDLVLRAVLPARRANAPEAISRR